MRATFSTTAHDIDLCTDGCPWQILGSKSGHCRGVVFKSETVTMGFTRCKPVDALRGPEQLAVANILTFPRSGVFQMHVDGQTYIADPNQVLFSNQSDTFRTSHPGAGGDTTVWMSFSRPVLVDALRPYDPGAEDREGSMFTLRHAVCEPGRFLMQHALFEYGASGGAVDPVFLDESLCLLLGRVVADSYRARGVRPTPSRPETTRVRAAFVEAVKELLATRLTERLTLAMIAAHVHVSQFHLCRTFRAHTGLPLHRYLSMLRLRYTVSRLCEHSDDLARLALDAGFSGHSHFADAFRREFGVPPSVLRDRLGSGQQRAMIDRL